MGSLGAWEKVKASKGAPGVDGCSIEEFEKDLRSNNLYKIWNRMSSGSYFPPPVQAVEIPKPHGGGTRVLGVPTVAGRIAQTVVAARLEKQVEPKFHQDSYGYRPGRSALDAVGKCRERCFKTDWVVDLDIQKFFAWDLMVKGVEANTDQRWVVLYVERWLRAPLQLPDGTLQRRDRGTPQGSAVSRAGESVPALYGAFYHSALKPLLRRINAYLMRWIRRKYKRLAGFNKAKKCFQRITQRYPRMFAHWRWSRNFW